MRAKLSKFINSLETVLCFSYDAIPYRFQNVPQVFLIKV